jgi:tetratricopeptide (TPR) repeat protein
MMTLATDSNDSLRELRQLVGSGRFRDAVDTYHSVSDPQWRGNPEAQLLTATSATRLGELGLAAPLAAAASARFRVTADRHGHMRATNLQGAVAWEQGELAKAESCFGDALSLARELDDSLMSARAANNLASLAQLSGNSDTALSLYRSALVTYQRLGDRRGLIETYHNLSIVFRHTEQFAQASEASDQALRLAEQLEDPVFIAPVLTGLAELRLVQGETDRARPEARHARELAIAAGDLLSAAEARRILALVYLQEGQFGLALVEAQEARRVAAAHGSALLEGESAAAEALVLRALDRKADAAVRRDAARAIFTRLGATWWLEEFDAAWG